MKKQATFIILSAEKSKAPLYRQIYEAIRRAILRGELAGNSQLPASRVLAAELGVSRITVVNAYEQLFAEGYLEGRRGAGTFVASLLPEDLLQIARPKAKKNDAGQKAQLKLSPFGERLIAKNVRDGGVRGATKFQPFQNGLTAFEEFPFEIWSRIAARYHKNPPRSMLGYGDPQGLAKLRAAIAEHLSSARGVNCAPEQIIITSGAQQALDLTARIFLSENDVVLVEDPCYAEARSCFAATGAKLVEIEVDEEGLNLAERVKTVENARLIYVTPSHQYPLGVTMSLARRLELLEWARANNAWIIEDDYNSEFRYAGRPLASLQGLDKDGRVIYVGTFSKTIFPALRIGCAVVPKELIGVFTAARALTDVHSSLLEQAILADFIAEGHFTRHIRRMRTLYEGRQEILAAECEKQLSNLLEVRKADAGMHLVGWLPEGVSDKIIAERAAKEGLTVAPVSSYATKKQARGGLILGYTGFNAGQIKEGVKKLKEILSAKIS